MQHSPKNKHPDQQTVAVGSQNPTKLDATKLAFEAMFPETSWKVIGIAVPSDVSDQPMSDKEAITGATNRAQKALNQSGADYGVGLEGGLNKIGDDWFECGWAVIVDKNGATGIGSSFRVLVPKAIMKHIHNGHELGHAVDMTFKTVDSKSTNGFFGHMTKEVITRSIGYRDGVIAALSRFVHPKLFD